MTKNLFLALLSVLTYTIHAESIKPQQHMTAPSAKQQPESAVPRRKTCQKNNVTASSTADKRHKRRRRGIIAGTLSFIGLSILAIVGYVISCIP